MTDLVPRTVTEIGEDGSPVEHPTRSHDDFGGWNILAEDEAGDGDNVLAGDNSPAGSEHGRILKDFEECDALVLLGAPGAGKTELFEAEGARDGCISVSARDFLTFDIDRRPEWRVATLFIDGLDEKRAGSVDGLAPLDDIRARLDALGRPRFRLSCREADWFGANDRTNLEAVSPDGTVKVLRLDPLSDESVRMMLKRRPDVIDVDKFMDEARQRGIDHLLTNPKNLEMLAEAVSGGPWPESRMRTFELACEKLSQEPNRGHQLANRNAPGTPGVLAAAERLCAIQLLTGYAGYDVTGHGSDSEYLGLQSIPGNDRATLRLALRARLFRSPEEGDERRTPEHRQIAEYLGARYLAKLITRGHPVNRVLALMAGEDGGIVSELRGLSAWLAAHCLQARRELIERDPEGVAAYGDAGVFTQDEKRHLLKCLHSPDPSLDASLFTSLATADMVPVIREILSDRRRDGDHRSLELFVLCVLANAPPLPELVESLLELATSEDHPQNSRLWAAICLAEGACEQPERFGNTARCLLAGLREGRIRDEGKNMLGRLLQFLYPKFIAPDEIFDYLDEDHERSRYFGDRVGPYDVFWQQFLAAETRSEDVVKILHRLEKIFERSDEWRRTGRPPASPLARAARWLVKRALDRTEEHEPQRTLRWLRLAGGENWGSSSSTKSIRAWIEARPGRYKALLREGVAQCQRWEHFGATRREVTRLLHGAQPPSDYGRWCLEESERAEGNDNRARFWFEEAWDALLHDKGAEGLCLEHLEGVATKNTFLARVFDRLRSTYLGGPLAKMEREERQSALDYRRKQEQAFAGWRRFYGQYEEALRENRCPAGALNTIAEAYLGSYLDISGENGLQRLREFLGEERLVEAAMDGLRGTIQRDDLPTPEDVLSLRAANQRHPLAFPVVAGLELIAEDAISALDDSLARVAVALLVASRPPSPEPAWVRPLFESRPNIAAGEIVRFATAALRRSGQQVSFVYEMLDYEWLSEVAGVACPRLLRAFPVRAPQHHSSVLKRLLWWGIANLDASLMESIVAGKLAAKSMTRAQRAYWLAAQPMVSTEPKLTALEDFVEKHENAMAGYFAFYERSALQQPLLERLPSPSLGRLARLVAQGRRPVSAVHSRPTTFRESDFVRRLIEALGARADDEAKFALAELADDPSTGDWQPTIRRVQRNQRIIRRDARFQHPNVGAVIQSLESRQPANVADLAALTLDVTIEISRKIRDGNTNDWRQYWDKAGASWRPAHEDDCRDALLSDLQARLAPLGVAAAPEGRYADAKRSDIEVSTGSMKVPVEIKKSSSRDLWSAIRNQLIAKYTRDPDAAGYGIYLVFWFGNEPNPSQMPESGARARTAPDLEERLRATLTHEETRLISVCVVDASMR